MMRTNHNDQNAAPDYQRLYGQVNAELAFEIAERRRLEEALRRSEEQLLHAQKLEAVGRFAGGIAHDFNNILAVVLSNCELLMKEMDLDTLGRSELEEIHGAVTRAADLARRLLSFSRRQVPDVRTINLNDVLRASSKILARVLGDDIELEVSLHASLALVRADSGHLEQVIMNLAVNARDAMPQGGVLAMRTANVELRSNERPGLSAGAYVVLTVKDTGLGMDRATQARIFEPFFTTKEEGRGTGLGLATVAHILKLYQGNAQVFSMPGKGTTFELYLPVADPAEEPATSSGEVSLRSTETILLVEDDDQVRSAFGRGLRRAGFLVLEAKDPLEALRVSQQQSKEINLLLTDVILPKMRGYELAERIGRMRPDVKILFMSGYAEGFGAEHAALAPETAFIRKPITLDALTCKVRRLLDDAPGTASRVINRSVPK